ncbi:DUF4139 domain-containing protein [Scleromatobacter humisilvae]|uniref:DUF4139 domain-containing protein n=1 Tax=Scleromatobacter humisilvae TaxID=2897159 RepID=A0A9X1YDK8_9BURK|nr:DUF4139 domain-containing protein [Scleromatobacter humisilvae]MCK9684194.1 DUF4139 domain-containing protein [Scleromatobacter humisilvae]
MIRTRLRALAGTVVLLAGAPFAAHGQDVSRVVAATIYSHDVLVERQLKTPGGTRHVQVACMPPGFRADTLQVDGDASLHLGDVRTEPVTGDDALACARGPVDARIRALEDQKAALKSQASADDIALDYLRRWNGSTVDAPAARASAPARALPAADTLRKSAVDLMADQSRVAHQVADLDRQLAELRKSVRRTEKGNWSTLRLDLSTAGPATLRLRYELPSADWQVSYRASLDTSTSTLRIERQAEITQNTGEDWTDVALTLSTGYVDHPNRPQRLPDSWNLTPPERVNAGGSASNDAMVQRVEVTGSSISPFVTLPESPLAAPTIDTTPVVGIQVEERDWQTLFHTTQPIAMPSDGLPHLLALDSLAVPVKVRVQVIPLQSLNGYLLADAPTPAGSWPEGKVQIWRDGSLIAQVADWSPDGDDGRLSLYFGRDDRVRVSVQRPPSMSIAVGLFGSEKQQSWGSVFVVSNGHTTPQTIELIDPAPVSHTESVKVQSRYEPAPSVTDWQHKPGVNAWTIPIAPNQTKQVSVSHQVTFPKDERIRNLPQAQ